jgi:glutathione S-transferase
MIVYGNTLSPFVRKTLAFAAEKGIEVELVAAGMGQGPPEFKLASPFGKMPAFKDGDFMLADSTAIITYLEAIKPEPNLIPSEPKARARAIWFEEFADTIVGACVGKVFFNRVVAKMIGREADLAAADEAAAIEVPKALDYLEGVIPPSGFLVEDRITLADIAVASPFQNLHLAACPIDPARYPKSAKYIDAVLARPSYAAMVQKERAMFKAREPA